MKNATTALLLSLTLVACGGDSDTDATPETEETTGTVTIVTPMEGALINGSTVTVQLSSSVPIVPAGELTEGTGHHHLYLDADLTPADQPVPTVPGSIVHMGDASATYVFEGVAPGEHRIIAVVADGVHVPLQPWVVDTVRFTVGGN
ncbi:MAG: DUF4399 domain-containing protein [Gemmatimonadota bacterium]|nr:DUF4399 domain-containing protein [Gemmatimonadota bacterium]